MFLILNIAIIDGLMLIRQEQKHKFQIGNIAVNVAKKWALILENKSRQIIERMKEMNK